MRTIVFMLVCLLSCTTAHSASLVGSSQALKTQNRVADRHDLSRLTEATLPRFKKNGLLVPLPNNRYVRVDPRLNPKYRWCRPFTRDLLLSLGKEYYEQFGEPLQINSAVRTEEYQRRLQRTNANAARGEDPDKRSSHLTGATVDIAKKPMSRRQIRWMRARLLALERAGRIEVTEEFSQAVFHVMVYPRRK